MGQLPTCSHSDFGCSRSQLGRELISFACSCSSWKTDSLENDVRMGEKQDAFLPLMGLVRLRIGLCASTPFEFHRNIGFLSKGKSEPQAEFLQTAENLPAIGKPKRNTALILQGAFFLEELFERAVLPEMMSSTHIHCSALRWNKKREGCRAERVVGLFLIMHLYFNFWGMKTFYSVRIGAQSMDGFAEV
ncbi:hypothetical protein CEXT_656441 [Caerostris extrusa]|uniref:Uncharacterized protein n=1 Tax=Caerostris extrusa TaxID=172846 RepID=A0AAV4UGF4_CAEEX|nr:hypothetical protein CEXT_656441 [Caerostris extrusa]